MNIVIAFWFDLGLVMWINENQIMFGRFFLEENCLIHIWNGKVKIAKPLKVNYLR